MRIGSQCWEFGIEDKELETQLWTVGGECCAGAGVTIRYFEALCAFLRALKRGVDERDEPVQTRFLLRELGGEVVVLAYDVRVWAT